MKKNIRLLMILVAVGAKSMSAQEGSFFGGGFQAGSRSRADTPVARSVFSQPSVIQAQNVQADAVNVVDSAFKPTDTLLAQGVELTPQYAQRVTRSLNAGLQNLNQYGDTTPLQKELDRLVKIAAKDAVLYKDPTRFQKALKLIVKTLKYTLITPVKTVLGAGFGAVAGATVGAVGGLALGATAGVMAAHPMTTARSSLVGSLKRTLVGVLSGSAVAAIATPVLAVGGTVVGAAAGASLANMSPNQRRLTSIVIEEKMKIENDRELSKPKKDSKLKALEKEFNAALAKEATIKQKARAEVKLNRIDVEQKYANKEVSPEQIAAIKKIQAATRAKQARVVAQQKETTVKRQKTMHK